MQQEPTIPQSAPPDNPTVLNPPQPAASQQSVTPNNVAPVSPNPVSPAQTSYSNPDVNIPPITHPQQTEDPDESQVVASDVRKSSKGDGWKSALSTIGILVAAPLLAILLTTFVFQSYEVDGESMESTLQHKDRLIVWKVPASLATLTNKDYIPKRGEIVVFHRQTASSGPSADKQLIKRVIALPGERIVIRDGKITVYNSENPEGFNPDEAGLYGKETSSTPGLVDMVVPESEVFVVGDNRNNSLDSRAFGGVSSEDLVGELSLRIYPFDKAEKF